MTSRSFEYNVPQIAKYRNCQTYFYTSRT